LYGLCDKRRKYKTKEPTGQARGEKARQGKRRQAKARESKRRQEKASLGKASLGKARQGNHPSQDNTKTREATTQKR
jgi:hypothetical protein